MDLEIKPKIKYVGDVDFKAVPKVEEVKLKVDYAPP
jgi:hypothetical protein